MARAIYIVLHSRQRWWVDFEGKPYGPFTNREIAKQEAISMARFASHGGRQTEVQVPDETGRYWMEWESGHDPKWSHWKPGTKPSTSFAPEAWGPAPRLPPSGEAPATDRRLQTA